MEEKDDYIPLVGGGLRGSNNNIQGATLTNGILDLNNPPSRLKPLTIQDVYVAISRFTSMSDFKICPLVNAKDKLKWPKNLKYFYDCIDPSSGKFNAAKYLNPATMPREIALEKEQPDSLLKKFAEFTALGGRQLNLKFFNVIEIKRFLRHFSAAKTA